MTTHGAILNTATVPLQGWDLLETKTLVANADSVTFSSLDGDTHQMYMLIGRVINNHGSVTASYSARPNGATTNQSWQRLYANDTTVAGSRGTTPMLVAQAVSAGGSVFFSSVIWASKATSSRRYLLSQALFAGTIESLQTVGQWDETSTNITSLVFFSDQTDGVGTGSIIHLYRKAPA